MRGSAHELVKFIRAVAVRILVAKLPVTLDFRATNAFAPAGTLLLFAELDRIVQLSQHPKPITIRAPRRRRPREVMKQIGIFETTGDSVDLVPERRDVVYWRATKGADQSGESFGPTFEQVTARVDKDAADQMAARIWPGLSEAIANTIDHAYVMPDRGDGFPHCPNTRWWMFTHLRDGVFTVAVCDLGIGYLRRAPTTLPEAFLAQIGKFLTGSNLDARAIQAAMAYGKSSTGGKERGKGSRDALSVLQNHGEGELIVLSNSAAVIYQLKRGEPETSMRVVELSAKCLGTIVFWKLPVLQEAL